jgi:hypothetical protein
MLASPVFLIDDKSESEVAELAPLLRFVRPLVPYPSWRFDADWDNPDLAFQMRQKIWRLRTGTWKRPWCWTGSMACG